MDEHEASKANPLSSSGKARTIGPLRRMVPYINRHRRLAIGAGVFLCLAAATTLTLPLAVRRMIDFGFNSENAGLIDNYFAMLLAVAALLAMASALRYFFVIALGERVITDLRADVFSHVMTLPSQFHDISRSGEIVSRLTADTTQLKSAIGATASLALRNLILGTGALIMMLATSPGLSSVVIGVLPLIVLPLVWFGRRVRKRSRFAQDTLADAMSYASEAIGAVRSFQAFSQEKAAARHFSDDVETAFRAARATVGARAVLTAFGIFLVFGSVVTVLWLGARGVMDGTMTAGTLSQFLLYALFAAGALAALSETWGELQLAAGAAERLSELLEEDSAIADPENPAIVPQRVRGDVVFDRVHFAYPVRNEETVVRDLSFSVPHGQTVAIVGASGAGKSTILSLLLRQYDAQSGTITIDGTDITRMRLHDLRRQMALVPQDVTILSGTAAENIAFGRHEADLDAIMAAAKAAQAHDFIMALPDGYDTQVGERGVALSGGQRQRIAIARALLRDAPILLLDEATSALDAESEALVQRALETLMEGRTTLVIAHRLATIRKADTIIVMDKGQIVETGDHESLRNRTDGIYARLADLQFDRETISHAAE